MQSPQTPNYLRYHESDTNNHPQLDEFCSQPATITHFEWVLEKIDRQQRSKKDSLQHKHPQNYIINIFTRGSDALTSSFSRTTLSGNI
jgi:hypothetical protein